VVLKGSPTANEADSGRQRCRMRESGPLDLERLRRRATACCGLIPHRGGYLHATARCGLCCILRRFVDPPDNQGKEGTVT
jgi:hypothetical protein